ncbi:MAG: hypothetical protein ACYDEX_24740 [Mobilitalea sp.]
MSEKVYRVLANGSVIGTVDHPSKAAGLASTMGSRMRTGKSHIHWECFDEQNNRCGGGDAVCLP